ncbi:MAG: response regulator transcription factor [Chloroflexi bacterium]|nr:response regulator transcription factor [Chloroflexota bacterium]
MRVLIVEDDERQTRLIARVLERERIAVDVAHDGHAGLELALRGTYDVAIIDWMLPGRDGPSICRSVRAAQLPVALLMLTARDQLADRVAGLDAGADDYLAKPFAFEELLARVRALSRRFTVVAGDGAELRHGDLVLDVKAHAARRADQDLQLTPTEWAVLECLMRHPGQALTRQQVLDYVGGAAGAAQQATVDVYIFYLRRKLAQPGRPDPIETVRGIGYRLGGV